MKVKLTAQNRGIREHKEEEEKRTEVREGRGKEMENSVYVRE